MSDERLITENTLDESIRFASGVEITAEEIKENPALKEKLLMVKSAEANLQSAYQKSQFENKELRNKINETIIEDKVDVKAEAKKENNRVVNADSVDVDPVRLYNLQQMTRTRFSEAITVAENKFGKQVLEMIKLKITNMIKQIIDEGRYDAPFELIFDQAFTTLVTEDAEASRAFAEYKLGLNPEQIQIDAEHSAKIGLLRESANADSVNSLPQGGAQVVTAPADIHGKPKSMADAHQKARARAMEMMGR